MKTDYMLLAATLERIQSNWARLAAILKARGPGIAQIDAYSLVKRTKSVPTGAARPLCTGNVAYKLLITNMVRQ